MFEPAIPQNLDDFLHTRLLAMHESVQLVFLFDPAARLDLGEELQAGGRRWRVMRYDGNDLAFRAAWAHVAGEESRRIVWVAPRTHFVPGGPPITISSLTDLLAITDDWVDVSVAGILAALIPNETWPIAALEQHGDVLLSNLPAVVAAHEELRERLGVTAALDAATVRVLALHAGQPSVRAIELLVQRDSARQLLDRYLRLAWNVPWSTAQQVLLQEHVRAATAAADASIAPWLGVSPDELAVYLYARRFLGNQRVPLIASHLRGLGVLSFDPAALEPWVDVALGRWEREEAWRNQLIVQAEARLADHDLARLAELAGDSSQAAWGAIATTEAPGLIVRLAVRTLRAVAPQEMRDLVLQWPDAKSQRSTGLPPARGRPAAEAIIGFLDEVAAVLGTLNRPSERAAGLAGLVDWYVQGGYFDLEYGIARAGEHLRALEETEASLVVSLRQYLTGLRRSVRKYLAELDTQLAEYITVDWPGYFNGPRLAINIVSDLVKKRRLRPSADECVWVVIFDGMRWDTWQRVVKPRLLTEFEMMEPEKAYLSVLPSWTLVARTSLLAGQLPARWNQGERRGNPDQKALAARAFGLSPGDSGRNLRFYSGMESDRTYLQLDAQERFPWNVLIFNISDDGLHQERDNVAMLNDKIAAPLAGAMQTLQTLVRPGDTVVVSSDHGFMELDESDGVLIQDAARWQQQVAGAPDPVRFRYLYGLKSEVGVAFDLAGYNPSHFTVAVGPKWFKRSDGRQRPDRYAHGGLSLAEMVVPGALVRRIVARTVDAFIDELPGALAVDEGQPAEVSFAVVNRGNQACDAVLAVRLDGEPRARETTIHLEPGVRLAQRSTCTPSYISVGHGRTFAEIVLSYQDATGQRVARRYEVPIKVNPRRDVVEIQFAGLDALDEL